MRNLKNKACFCFIVSVSHYCFADSSRWDITFGFALYLNDYLAVRKNES